jgi:hypothetical protein
MQATRGGSRSTSLHFFVVHVVQNPVVRAPRKTHTPRSIAVNHGPYGKLKTPIVRPIFIKTQVVKVAHIYLPR